MLLIPAGAADATCVFCDPVRALYEEVDEAYRPVLTLSPVVDSLPSVYFTWAPAAGIDPTHVTVYRTEAGRPDVVVTTCDEPAGCTNRFALDRGDGGQGLVPNVEYEYQVAVSDGVRGGILRVVESSPEPAPRNFVARRIESDGGIELRWRAQDGIDFFRIQRRNLSTRTTESLDFVEGQLRVFVDEDAQSDVPYEYLIQTCEDRDGTSCSYLTDALRIAIGGPLLIHDLEERVARHRFRPDDDLKDESQGVDNSFVPSERLIYRDGESGAPVAKLTNDVRRDHNIVSNLRVWSRDGSTLTYTSYGWHWGLRVMNADGSELRDLEPLTAAGWNVRWSRTENDVLYYFGRSGVLGRLLPPSEAGPQQDLGLVWQAPDGLDTDFVARLHPDGTRAIATRETNDGTRVYLVDLDTGTTEADSVLLDPDNPNFFMDVQQLWFTKDPSYSILFNAATFRDGEWLLGPPYDGVADCVSQSCKRMAHVSPSPDGTRVAFLKGGHVEVTNFADGETNRISEMDGHYSWQVDNDWFAASSRDGIYRVWVDEYLDSQGQPVTDGHETLIATPYTNVMYRGEINAELHPELSPDGTKVSFNSPMHGDIDLYYAVLRLPGPPRDLTLAGLTLEWLPPEHLNEVELYNVWRSTVSGQDYELLDTLPASACSYTLDAPGSCEYVLGDATGYYYVVTAVEHSDLEGLPSNEATAVVVGNRQHWIEPHLGEISRPLAPIYHGDFTGLYALEAITDSAPLDQAAVTLRVPAGSWFVWARTRGGGPGAVFDVLDGPDPDTATPLGSLAAEEADWEWVVLGGGSVVVSDAGGGEGDLTLLPSELGVAIDQLLLTSDVAFVPSGAPTHMRTLALPPPAVTGLDALPESFACALSWDATAAANFSHYNVYATSDPVLDVWDQKRLVASIVESELLDWGLASDTEYRYRVSVVDRQGNESALAATTCTTVPIVLHHVEEIPEDPDGVLLPDAATGKWIFPYDIPAAASPAEFVAWIQVHFPNNFGLNQETVLRTVGNGLQRVWDLERDMTPITEGVIEMETRMWVVLPLAETQLQILRPAPLPPGPGEIVLETQSGAPLGSMRVTGFVLTNDLAYLPDGITDYVFPDTRTPPDPVPPSPACDDGVDNDGDGVTDAVNDPGCDDSADTDEQSPALACDDGVDNDGDGRVDLVDLGCVDGLDSSERSSAQCDDGVDNDGDGDIDLADAGCADEATQYETVPDCDDGIDNDGDGQIDYDGHDPGCRTAADFSELADCDDGLDNDFDGATDLDDLGCRDAEGVREDPACSDGVDNDGDGLIDWSGGPGGEGADPECQGRPFRNKETVPPDCGLGFELALLVPLLMAVRRRLGAVRPRRAPPVALP